MPARRWATGLFAVLVLAGGLAGRAFLPPGVRGPVGDNLYATFAVLLVALVRPRTRAWVAGLVGLAFSAAVEGLQATGIAADVVARVPLARFVLGTTFVPMDLAWYVVGAGLGGLLVALAAADVDDLQVRHTKTDRPAAGRRAKVTALVLAPVLVLGAGAGAVGWVLHGQAQDLREKLPAAQAVLVGSAGKVADDATRTALQAALDDADDTLRSAPFVKRWPGDAPDAARRVAAQVQAVTQSRLAKGRADAATARDALPTVTARADQVLAATDGQGAGQGADPATRQALATLLSQTAATIAAASDERLQAQDDPFSVEKTATDLTEAFGAVEQATVALMTAQDAAVCPFPDQVWFPESGKIADADLAAIPWAPRFRVRADVLPGLVELDKAFQAQFGHHLVVNSAYRSYDEQVDVYNPDNPNPLAAVPGCSNHGLGTAVDLDGISSAGNAQYAWLKANAERFGWTHPDWAEPGGRLPEPWHWQSVKTPTSY